MTQQEARSRIIQALDGRFSWELLHLICEERTVTRYELLSLWQSAGLGASDPVNLYVHVPFCTRKCGYCKYASDEVRDPARVDAYLSEILSSIEMFAPVFAPVEFRTFYMGGGTVTTLSPQQLDTLLGTAFSGFRVREDSRTSEFGLDTCTLEHLRVMKRNGIGRISCGIQTFDEAILRHYNRPIPDPARVAEILGFARENFATNNTDLIFGLAGQTVSSFLEDVERLVAFDPGEIHCYFYEPNPGDVLNPIAARYDEVAAIIERRYTERYRVEVTRFAIHLLHRNRAGFVGGYTLHDARRTHTLGLGTYAGSRIYGVGEYHIDNNGIGLMQYPEGFQQFQYVSMELMERHRVDLAAYESLFSESFVARHGDAVRSSGSPPDVVLSETELAIFDPFQQTRTLVAMLPEACCATALHNLGKPATTSKQRLEIEIPGHPDLAAFASRLLSLPGESAGAGPRPVRLVIDVGVLNLSYFEADGQVLDLTLKPHQGGESAFESTGRIDLLYRGRTSPALILRMKRACRLLSAYEMADLVRFVEKAAARSGPAAASRTRCD